MLLLAGQIGLTPDTMKIAGEGEGGQVARNVAKVLDGMGQGLGGALGVLVYFNEGFERGGLVCEEVEREVARLVGEVRKR